MLTGAERFPPALVLPPTQSSAGGRGDRGQREVLLLVEGHSLGPSSLSVDELGPPHEHVTRVSRLLQIGRLQVEDLLLQDRKLIPEVAFPLRQDGERRHPGLSQQATIEL